jgi:hypothetical protein
MSTHFRPLSSVHIADLLNGRLNVREHDTFDRQNDTFRKCLTDGENFLWVSFDSEGFVTSFTRYAPNGSPREMLRMIEEAFGLVIASEYEPQYWGFNTELEWDAAWEAQQQPT